MYIPPPIGYTPPVNNEMIQAQSGAHDRMKERREEDESEVTIS